MAGTCATGRTRAGDRPLVRRRRHGPWRAAGERPRGLVPQSLGAHRQLRQAVRLYNNDLTRNLHASVANTHVIRHAGKTLALVETSLPYQITNELETLGAYDFGGKLADSMTAHPKICPTTGELHFFGYGSLTAPYVTYHRADASGDLTINRGIDVGAHTMMHDFALTGEHVIFMDLPVVFNVDVAFAANATCPIGGDDNYGARFGVMRPRRPVRRQCAGSRSTRATSSTSPTPYDDGNSIVLQAVRYPELWRHHSGFEVDGVMWRWTIDLTTGTVTERQLDDRSVEFPRIDDRFAGLPARYGMAVGDGSLLQYDLETGAAQHASVPGQAG